MGVADAFVLYMDVRIKKGFLQGQVHLYSLMNWYYDVLYTVVDYLELILMRACLQGLLNMACVMRKGR